jgi:hypothetical protein
MAQALKQCVILHKYFILTCWIYVSVYIAKFTERNIYSNVDFETFRLFTQGNATLALDLNLPGNFFSS